MFKKTFLILAISLLSFVAQADEIYTVKSIKIAASAKNASMARNIALEKGQLKAFTILVKQHFPAALEKIPSLSNEAILSTIAGFELSEEKRSATNYFAKVNIKFSREHIDKLMSNLGASFSKSRPIVEHVKEEVPLAISKNLPDAVTSPTMTSLIVPVVEQAGKTYWLEDENAWLSFWHNKLSVNYSKSTEGKEKFILPVGDLEDLTLLNKHILNKNIIDLSSLFERYNVNNIVLIRLGNLENLPTHHLTLQVNYINKYNSAWQQHNFADLEGDNLQMLIKQAAEEIEQFSFISNQGNMINRNDKFPITSSHVIDVDFPIEKLSDWIHLEKIITDSQYITNLQLKMMNVDKYQFSFSYKISFLDLQAFFKNHNFSLKDEGDNQFLLTRDVPSAEY